MIDCNPMRAVCNYGSSAPYKDPPTEEQIRCGVIPLDSLPAAWWNWLWNETNSAVNEARSALTSVISELNNVLSCAGITPQSACMDQLYKAITNLRQTTATAATAGSVKSSSVCGQVSVANDGIMTANGLGNVSNLSTTSKTNVVEAINELKSVYDGSLQTMSGAISSLENNKLSCTGCAADSALLGGTGKADLLTAFETVGNDIQLTVGGTTCCIPVPTSAACFGTASAYVSYKCSADGEAEAAECRVNLGCGRSYNWSENPQDVRSFDRRTYTYIGTCQDQNRCSGMTFIDTCSWQCCYSGSAGVISCKNNRWCFCSNGNMYAPGAVTAASETFGCMLIANRVGSAYYASLTFQNCLGVLGHLGMSSANGDLMKWNAAGSACCKVLTSSDVGAAAYCAATAFRPSSWTPYWVTGSNMSCCTLFQNKTLGQLARCVGYCSGTNLWCWCASGIAQIYCGSNAQSFGIRKAGTCTYISNALSASCCVDWIPIW